MHKMVETFEYDCERTPHSPTLHVVHTHTQLRMDIFLLPLGVDKNIVFLTNKQAGLVGGNQRSIKLLFEFL